jgi:hypothetical protein
LIVVNEQIDLQCGKIANTHGRDFYFAQSKQSPSHKTIMRCIIDQSTRIALYGIMPFI